MGVGKQRELGRSRERERERQWRQGEVGLVYGEGTHRDLDQLFYFPFFLFFFILRAPFPKWVSLWQPRAKSLTLLSFFLQNINGLTPSSRVKERWKGGPRPDGPVILLSTATINKLHSRLEFTVKKSKGAKRKISHFLSSFILISFWTFGQSTFSLLASPDVPLSF